MQSNINACPLHDGDFTNIKTVCFGPVPIDIQADSVINYISYFGEIISSHKRIVCAIDDVRSTYLLVLTFDSGLPVRELVNSSPHYIGRRQFFAAAIQEGYNQANLTADTTHQPSEHTVHIKGIKPWMVKKELRVYLRSFGSIERLTIFKRRNYAFVTFKNVFSFKFLTSLKKANFVNSMLFFSKASSSNQLWLEDIAPFYELPRFQIPERSTWRNSDENLITDFTQVWPDNQNWNHHPSIGNREVSAIDSASLDSSHENYARQVGFPGRLDFSNNITEHESSQLLRDQEESERPTIEIIQVVKTTIRLRKNGIYYQKRYEDSNSWVYFSNLQ